MYVVFKFSGMNYSNSEKSGEIIYNDVSDATKKGENNPRKSKADDGSLDSKTTEGFNNQPDDQELNRVLEEYANLEQLYRDLFKDYDVETLTFEECMNVSLEERQLRHNSFIYRYSAEHLCDYCDEFAAYAQISDRELENMASVDDIGALHFLGVRYMNNPARTQEGINLLERAIALGSKPAAMFIASYYRNEELNNQAFTDEQRQLSHSLFLNYYRVSEYRYGRYDPANDPTSSATIEGVESVADLISRITSQRQALGLPEFVNRSYPAWPEGFEVKCVELSNQARDQMPVDL